MPSARMMNVVAALLIVVGGVWSFQGAGFLGGSFMTGESRWLRIGIVCVVAGLGLLAVANRKRW